MGYHTQQQAAMAAAAQQRARAAQTHCVLLSGMFDPAQEEDPDFDFDIREDVREEVSKYGRLEHIYVDKLNSDGLVYLKFDSKQGAAITVNKLDKRWFAKRQIKATFFDEKQYKKMHPHAYPSNTNSNNAN